MGVKELKPLFLYVDGSLTVSDAACVAANKNFLFFVTGNRQQAFAYALSSACLVHTVAKACSAGLSSKCRCAPASGRSDATQPPPPAGYRWAGCADDVEFASSFGEQFTDRIWKRRRVSRRTATNLHNTVAGRRVNTRHARCYVERGIATTIRPSVSQSICDVEVSWPHRLEYFENNFMTD